MKIAVLHYSAPPVVGGVESVIAHHAQLMAQGGHTVTIFAGRGEAFDPRVAVRIVDHMSSRDRDVLEVKRRLDAGQCDSSFEQMRDRLLAELTGELKAFDLVIAHNIATLNKNLPLTAALNQAWAAAHLPPLILWHHDLAWAKSRGGGELHAGYPWELLRTRWSGATQVTISEVRRTELRELWGDEAAPIRVIPNGIDAQRFFKLEPETIALADRCSLMDADPLLLLPARLTRRKNVEYALEVLAELRKAMPKAMLVVTGPEGPHNPANAAYKRELLDLRDRLQLQGSAHFLAEINSQPVADAVISDLYRMADALLLPSQEEGFGIPLIEAAASKLPVFCSDIPVLRELGGQDVTYLKSGAPAAEAATQIERRLQDESTSRWSRRARHTYTWERIYTTYLEPLLREVRT